MELSKRELDVLRGLAQYLITDGKLRYSDRWEAFVVSNETVLMQEEVDVLNKIAIC